MIDAVEQTIMNVIFLFIQRNRLADVGWAQS
jgi:hypothetical protein